MIGMVSGSVVVVVVVDLVESTGSPEKQKSEAEVPVATETWVPTETETFSHETEDLTHVPKT